METSAKPRMLYFAPSYDGVLVPTNMEPIVYRVDRWLEHFFEVTQINARSNLARLVEQHQPDIIFFDGCIEGCHKLRFKIEELYSYPEIPRAGLCRVDAHSPTSHACFEYLYNCGAEAIFVLGDTSMGESYPETGGKIVYVPQFIDPQLFRDYHEFKSIPVLMVGVFEGEQYPWRTAIRKPILDRFPAVYFRHPGYDRSLLKKTPIQLAGEVFARTVNASLIVPTSGGFRNITVSKHVEIPGARACLVTDPAESVKAFGFEHMKNCVLATADEAPDAIDYLLRNRDILENITDAGYELTHSRHTLTQRNQIVTWLTARQQKKATQRIVQPDHFGPLQLTETESKTQTLHLRGAQDVEILCAGDELLYAGHLEEAQAEYERAYKFSSYLGEAIFKLGLVKLMRGQAQAAWEHFLYNARWILSHGGATPDPIDATYAIISVLCAGMGEKVYDVVATFGNVKRLEYSRALWAIAAAYGRDNLMPDLAAIDRSTERQMTSMRHLRTFSFDEQMILFAEIFKVNGRENFANNLMQRVTQLRPHLQAPMGPPLTQKFASQSRPLV